MRENTKPERESHSDPESAGKSGQKMQRKRADLGTPGPPPKGDSYSERTPKEETRNRPLKTGFSIEGGQQPSVTMVGKATTDPDDDGE